MEHTALCSLFSVALTFWFLLSLQPAQSVAPAKRGCLTSLPTNHHHRIINKLCGRPPQYAPAPCKLTFDLLTLKVVSESRVMWATFVPILVFLGPLCSRLRPDIRDRQTDVRHVSSLNAPYPRGGYNNTLTKPQWVTGGERVSNNANCR